MSWVSELTADAPTLWWRLEETAGQHLDETANNHDTDSITVTGQGTADPDTGWAGVGKGDDFNGTTDFISAADHVDYAPTGTTAYTIEVVAEADTVDTTFRRVFSHESTSDGARMSVVNTVGEGWRIERQAGGATPVLNSGMVPTLGQTYHVVGTYDGANMNIYVNGAHAAGPQASANSMGDPAVPLQLGKRAFDSSRFFDGRIFEFAWYKGTALSLARIQAHYDARNDTGAPPITDGPKLMVARSNLRIA